MEITPLPVRGPSTDVIIGSIIGVLLFLAIIGVVIAMYYKCVNKNGPPKHKPPPPKKINSSANRQLNITHAPVTEDTPLQNQYYTTQSAEPVTDLDGFDDFSEEKAENYLSAAPSGWDDPENTEVLHPYMQTSNDIPGTNVHRGDSFVSPPVFV